MGDTVIDLQGVGKRYRLGEHNGEIRAWAAEAGFPCVEVSNGVVAMPLGGFEDGLAGLLRDQQQGAEHGGGASGHG